MKSSENTSIGNHLNSSQFNTFPSFMHSSVDLRTMNGSLPPMVPTTTSSPPHPIPLHLSTTNVNNLLPPLQHLFPIPTTGPSGTPPHLMVQPANTSLPSSTSPPNSLKLNVHLPTLSISAAAAATTTSLTPQQLTSAPPQKKKGQPVTTVDDDRLCVNCNYAGKEGRTFTGKYCVREGNQDKYNKFFGKALQLGSLCDFCYRAWYAHYTKMRILHPDQFQSMTENSLRGRKKNTEKASPMSNQRGGRRRKSDLLEANTPHTAHPQEEEIEGGEEEEEEEIVIEKSPLPENESEFFNGIPPQTENNSRSSMGRRAKRKLSYGESSVVPSQYQEEDEEEEDVTPVGKQKKNSNQPIRLDEEEEEPEDSDAEFKTRRGKVSRIKKEEEKSSRVTRSTETEDDDDQDTDFKMAKRRYNRRKKIKTEEVEFEDEEPTKLIEDVEMVSADDIASREKEMKVIDKETEREQVRKFMQQKSTANGQQQLVWCDRISVEEYLANPSIIDTYLFEKRVPVVISNFDKLLKQRQPTDVSYETLFSLPYLRERSFYMPMQPRDNILFEDLEDWTLGGYLNYLEEDRKTRKPTRLYGKDITCPDTWTQYLFEDSADNCMPERFRYKGKQDVIMSLDPKLQPITLMVYIGDEGTNTPGHKDLCGSLGHNLMVYAEPGDVKENDAYAFWTMFGTDDLASVTEFFSNHGGSLDEDNSFISISKLVNAPFKTYMVEQVLGDFVLVPPNCAHQVINKKGKNIKVAWNTLQVNCFPFSNYVLPIYRKYGKREVYRIKSLHYAHLTKMIQEWESHAKDSRTKKELQIKLNELQILLKGVSKYIHDDWIDSKLFDSVKHNPSKYTGEDDFPHSRTCNICLCDIFNRCIHYESEPSASSNGNHSIAKVSVMSAGAKSENDGVDICLDCFAQGRTCGNPSDLILQECVSMKQCKSLLERSKLMYQQVVSKLLQEDPSIAVESVEKFLFNNHNNHSVATIAFEMLEKRKHPVKHLCHQCQEPKDNFEMIQCHTTGKFYCNECLWNRYTKPLFACLQHKHWNSPFSKQVCNCPRCLQKRCIDPYRYGQVVLSNVQELQSAPLLPFTEVAVNQPSGSFGMSAADYNPDSLLGMSDNIELIDYTPILGMVQKNFVAIKKQ